jgi:hypothetical protein
MLEKCLKNKFYRRLLSIEKGMPQWMQGGLFKQDKILKEECSPQQEGLPFQRRIERYSLSLKRSLVYTFP